MHYEKTINLKDGRRCLIRNATAHDAKDILLNLKKVHEETNFLLPYPDEKGLVLKKKRTF